ncbi:MAG: hypothetical protein Q8O41_08170 [Candidatus Methanoperedens sp.]|nr:hypothetical protein [Candidatus Methanoperedens sp.]
MMIDLKQFEYKFQSFPSNYRYDFDEFWKWKLKVENGDNHILDHNHIKETYEKLRGILGGWQYFRSGRRYSGNPSAILRDALEKISDAYNQVRMYTLLEFSDTPDKPLELIWHELGRVKELGGNKRLDGSYNAIAICKPLMLLWGQTLAFDSQVRENISPICKAPKYGTRWKFETWSRVMKSLQKEELKQNSEIVDFFKRDSWNRYGANSIVPYGRYLDIYYF